MTYLSWAIFAEGRSDHEYFEVLIPRVLEEIAIVRGNRNIVVPPSPAITLGVNGRSVDSVATEICETRESFHLLFVHGDAGGRALEQTLPERTTAYCVAANELCDLRLDRCVVVAPKHETEAWALADPNAVMGALGFRGEGNLLGLPLGGAEAESDPDPKQTLTEATKEVRGRNFARRPDIPLAAIAQRQSIAELRRSLSFQRFEKNLVSALLTLGCLD